MNLKTVIEVEGCEISIDCTACVGANLFSRKRLIMQINFPQQSDHLRFEE